MHLQLTFFITVLCLHLRQALGLSENCAPCSPICHCLNDSALIRASSHVVLIPWCEGSQPLYTTVVFLVLMAWVLSVIGSYSLKFLACSTPSQMLLTLLCIHTLVNRTRKMFYPRLSPVCSIILLPSTNFTMSAIVEMEGVCSRNTHRLASSLCTKPAGW